MVALAAPLEVNTSIEKMVLRANDIGAGGAPALAKALEVNTEIERTSLTADKIDTGGSVVPAGLCAAFESLSRNHLKLQGV